MDEVTLKLMASADASAHLIAPGEHPDIAARAVVSAGKAECARRIIAVADDRTQANMQAEFSANLMDDKQAATYRAFLTWVRDMREARRSLSADVYPSDDSVWPDLPVGVFELARQY